MSDSICLNDSCMDKLDRNIDLKTCLETRLLKPLQHQFVCKYFASAQKLIIYRTYSSVSNGVV